MRESTEGRDVVVVGESPENPESVEGSGDAMPDVLGLESSSVVDSFVVFCLGRKRLEIPDTMMPG